MDPEIPRAGVFYEGERRVGHLAPQVKTKSRSIPKTRTSRHYLPRIRVSADVSVVDTTARTVLTQIFSNDTETTIEHSSYCFPLYDGSVITSFYCWFGRDTIKGIVKPKDEARQEFRDAISRRYAATLLDEHTSEVFETALGNIPPQCDVRVEITYLTELKADLSGDGVLVTIPTAVAPRYGRPPISYSKSPTAYYRAKAEREMKIQVNVSAPVPIRALDCRSHPISVELGSAGNPTQAGSFRGLVHRPTNVEFDNKKARATLSDRTAILDKDFVLNILAAVSEEPGRPNLLAPRAVMESSSKFPGYSAVKAAFTPRDLFTVGLAEPGFKMEIIFLADRSGSMELKIEALKRALRQFLTKIPAGCCFNICSFGSTFETLWPKSKPFSLETSEEAHQHLSEKFNADLGGTEILSALEQAVSTRQVAEDLTTQILVLTDGEIWEVESTVGYVRSTKAKIGGNIRFFALGIGDEVSHRTVEGIGRYGGGFSEVVAVDSPVSWDDRVMRMLNGLFTPSTWTCEVNLTGEPNTPSNHPGDPSYNFSSKYADNVIRCPNNIPVLHGLCRSTIYFLIHGSSDRYDQVTVQGVSSQGLKVTMDIPIERTQVSDPMLHYLAAKAILNDLETGQSWLHSQAFSKYKGQLDALQKDVILEAQNIGVRWGIPGRWTSIVGISSSTATEHSSRVYKTDRLELYELTRRRRGDDMYDPRDKGESLRLLVPQGQEDSEEDESKEDPGKQLPFSSKRNPDSDDDDMGDGLGGATGGGPGGWKYDGRGRGGGPSSGNSGEGENRHGRGQRQEGATDAYEWAGIYDSSQSHRRANAGVRSGQEFAQTPTYYSQGAGSYRSPRETSSDSHVPSHSSPRWLGDSESDDSVDLLQPPRLPSPGWRYRVDLLQPPRLPSPGRRHRVDLLRPPRIPSPGWRYRVDVPLVTSSHSIPDTETDPAPGLSEWTPASNTLRNPPSVSGEAKDVIDQQDSDGAFFSEKEKTSTATSGILDKVLQSFQTGVIESMQKHLESSDHLQDQEKTAVCRTVVCITYLTKKFPESKWELAVSRAQCWLRRAVKKSIRDKLDKTATEQWEIKYSRPILLDHGSSLSRGVTNGNSSSTGSFAGISIQSVRW